MRKRYLIAIDWGSSRYRAYLLDENGDILDKHESPDGVFNEKRGSFDEIFYRSCRRWLKDNPGLPVIMCGMIGSQQGWFETPYLPCPVSVNQLNQKLVQVPDIYDNPLFIVPGIASSSRSAFKDVMRGEETQLCGLMDNATATDMVVCLPGTHSKWAHIEENKIKDFMTFLTGELFESIKSSASLRSIITVDACDDRAFEEGVKISRTPGGLSHHLFSIRSRFVSRESECGIYSSYLSGLLIGTEILEGLKHFVPGDSIKLAGDKTLTHQYRKAFSQFSIETELVDSDHVSVNGLLKIATASQFIKQTVT